MSEYRFHLQKYRPGSKTVCPGCGRKGCFTRYIDEETAPIVRLIFGYALNGHGPNYIRRRLEEEKIPCPTWWNRERGLRNTRTKWEKKDPENGRYMWDFSVIKDLLMNPVYTGAIASQKKDYRFKIGTIGEKKPEDWIVVEGQHEPLIDRMSFDIVQNKLKSRQRPGQTNEISLVTAATRPT